MDDLEDRMDELEDLMDYLKDLMDDLVDLNRRPGGPPWRTSLEDLTGGPHG